MTNQVQLYKIPETLEVARVLDDSVLDAYNDSIRPYNERAKQVLGKFNKSNGELTGSNLFMLVHLQNSGLLPAGARLSTRKDLETALYFDNSFLRGNYADFGLALRSDKDSHSNNDLLAKRSAEQLKQQGIQLGKGKLIPFSALKLQEDSSSAYGLVFDLNDQAKDTITDLNYLKWDYKRDEGLTRAFLGTDGYWGSDGGGLDYSVSSGRVVVVSGEASSQNFSEYAKRLQEERDSQVAKIDKKYQEALRVLRD